MPSRPEGEYVRILPESLLWEERLSKTRMIITEGLITCMEPHRGWTITSNSWIFLQIFAEAMVGLRTSADHGHPRGN